jgi:hypothetical protein
MKRHTAGRIVLPTGQAAGYPSAVALPFGDWFVFKPYASDATSC